MSVINTNIKALAAQDSGRIAENKLTTAMQRLSTGLRINSAKDDAAGLAISTRMNSQIRGLGMAIRNANDGISLTQTAEGAMGQVASMLQRMRELSVQASNGTLTDSDRASLQAEVGQLKTEINSIAEKTNFNTIKLLDGSARDILLQTGDKSGQDMTISFDSVKTKDIGIGTKATLTSVGGQWTSSRFGAFVNGALLLNGVAVGPSLSTDDTASTSKQATSAIAKVAAINRVSAQSGVSAKIATNEVAGAQMTGGATTTAGTIVINGVSTAAISTTTDTSVSRSRVVDAINAISNQTGVVAIDTHDDNQGVVLQARDGRNINVWFDKDVSVGLTSSNTGVNATAYTVASAAVEGTTSTFVGKYELYSNDGSDFSVNNAFSSNLDNIGLKVGTYHAGVAEMVGYSRGNTTAGTAPSSSDVGVLNGNTLIINDVQIAAAVAGDDTSSYASTASTKAASAIAIAAAINKKSDVTGVTAEVQVNRIRGSGFTAYTTGTAGTLNINGVAVTVTARTRDELITEINAVQVRSGVKAVADGDGLALEAADGRNILLSYDATASGMGASAASFGLAGVTIATAASGGTAFYSSVALKSDKAFVVKRGSEAPGNFEALGFRVGTFGGENAGAKIAEVDISTSSGANQALNVIDAAIEKVAANQAKAGAYNNRLDAIVNNLTDSSQNATASRSRILDTDYATETTNLAKNQIIQQAATAMLAQANQSAQTVLALLK